MTRQILKRDLIKREYNRRFIKINEYDKEIIKLISKGRPKEGSDTLYLILNYIKKINKIKRILYQKEITLNHYIKNLNKN